MKEFNIYNVRDNKKRISKSFIGSIYNGFERALIWQDEILQEHSGVALTYAAKEKVESVVNVFLAVVYNCDIATGQILDHGAEKTGHDIALQMLGHGVGFWEQKETKRLDEILSFLMDCGAIRPFHLFYSESDNKLEWDCC